MQGERSFPEGVRVGFITIKEGKRRCLGGAMQGRVVVEFGGGKELYPFGWIVGAEDV